MSSATLIFPHQLFERNDALRKDRPVYVVEEYLFFRQYQFHKQKLTFHRASMKAYCSYLQSKSFDFTYVESKESISDVRDLLRLLKEKGIASIHYVDVTDCWLQGRISKVTRELDLELMTYESPLFISSIDDVNSYFGNKRHFFQADFYTHQRKRFKVLVDKDLQPMGGKWSFDAENRQKYPRKRIPPKVVFPSIKEFWKEAVSYVESEFPDNYGDTSDKFVYPTTFEEARAWLQQFFETRFAEFGQFEDALVGREHILHHSVFTPLLNVGLITPKEILNQAISFANKHDIPINSLEGFVRQILGWREFIRGVYELKGSQERTTNFWKFKRKIPKSFWEGTTGIPPVDITIKKVLATGYCHHIERLMVLGNFMLLCEFDPDDVYKWFMEMFIDSYDWVMVPNVYGMSQFADGGLMSTKPYISGSNYLMKMSDYEKGEWQQIWDGLFWRFMHTHEHFFGKNPRLGMLVNMFNKMPEEQRQQHLRHASEFLSKLDRN